MSLFSKDILALDWDHRQLRAVVASIANGAASVRRMFQEAVPPGVTVEDASSFGPWLAGVVSRYRCGGSHVLLAIPREQVVLKTLALPASTPQLEVPAIIQFQMQKELSFAAEDAVIDYTPAGGSPGGASLPAPGPANGSAVPGAAAPADSMPSAPPQCEFLVAAARRDVIQYYEAVADAAGLRLDRLGLRCFSNLETVQAAAGRDLAGRLLLVNVGPELTEIDVIRGGVLLFSRSASVALTEGDDPAEFLNRLAVEVVRTVQAARATVPNLELDGTIVAAPAWLAGSIAERLGQRLDVRGAVLEPGRGISLPPAHAHGAGEFSAALGLVLGQTRPGGPPFDFLHPRRPVDLVARTRQRRRMVAMLSAGAVAVLLAGNTAALTLYDGRIKPKQTRASNLKAEADRVSAFGRQFSDVLAYQKNAPVWLDETLRINEMWMSSRDGRTALHHDAMIELFDGRITPKGGWTIRLKGRAREAETVVDVRERLRALYPKPVAVDPIPKPPFLERGRGFPYSFEVLIESPPPGSK